MTINHSQNRMLFALIFVGTIGGLIGAYVSLGNPSVTPVLRVWLVILSLCALFFMYLWEKGEQPTYLKMLLIIASLQLYLATFWTLADWAKVIDVDLSKSLLIFLTASLVYLGLFGLLDQRRNPKTVSTLDSTPGRLALFGILILVYVLGNLVIFWTTPP